jgi:hypothetical protein
MAIDSITPYAQWPYWLRFVVVAPNALLAGITCWIWWPKTDRGWRRFGLVAAYLLVFFLVMHFIFKF